MPTNILHAFDNQRVETVKFLVCDAVRHIKNKSYTAVTDQTREAREDRITRRQSPPGWPASGAEGNREGEKGQMGEPASEPGPVDDNLTISGCRARRSPVRFGSAAATG